MEIYLKISKLLLAHKTQNISAQETEELLAWRQEKTENEELFQKISQADGFEQFRQQYEEYDFTPKFLLLEQKIKQEKRKRIIKRLSYAAILLPFIFAIWEIIQFQNQGTTPTEYSSIAPGSSKAILTIGKDKTIYIERDSNINIHKIDSNVFIQHNTLQYKKTAQATDNEIHKLNIPRGGEFFVCLSDGTKVWLNSESELKYASEFVGEERRVYLTGEAYFEVAKDKEKPFIVKANGINVQALGTSFNIRAHKDDKSVAIIFISGKVNVDDGRHEAYMKPNERLVCNLTNGQFEKSELHPNASNLLWRSNELALYGESFEEICTMLTRMYNCKFIFKNEKVKQYTYHGIIKNSSMNNVLEYISQAGGINYKIKSDNTIVIY